MDPFKSSRGDACLASHFYLCVARDKRTERERERMDNGSEVSNKQVVLKDYITGMPKETDMVIITGTIRLKVPQGSNSVLVKNLYLSCDPYTRTRMEITHDHYLSSFHPGSVICGYGVGKVIDSGHPNFDEGDYVWGFTGWEEYTLIHEPQTDLTMNKPNILTKIKTTCTQQLPLSYYIGILGMLGVAAYVGFCEKSSAKRGEIVFVSSACGAVGHIVGQLAKLMGCYVVGSVGSDHKVDVVKNKLGFDDAFNYKKEHDFNAAVKRYFPRGIDIYFDNVGGKMLDAVLPNMRPDGRIIASGFISQYNLEQPDGIQNLFHLITKRVRMEGFVAPDYYHLYPKYHEMMVKHLKEGKIVYLEDMVEGLENAPSAFVGLFTGRNIGKQVVVVARE